MSVQSVEKEAGFFSEVSQQIIKRLGSSAASAEEFKRWLSDPGEVEKRLSGTHLYAYLGPGGQRSAILARLYCEATRL